MRVTEARGSTPREAGALMAVTLDEASGTIGGGRLEHDAMAAARSMLSRGVGARDLHIVDQPLGPAIGQCCGGRVRLELRRVNRGDVRGAEGRFVSEWRERPAVLVFGAGHVGLALARALAPLPLRTTVVDERSDAIRQVPDGVDWELTPLPEAIVEKATPGTSYVVLTHDHALDFQIAAAALRRRDAAYVGMIGSATKRVRFRNEAVRGGLPRELAERLICPMAAHARRDKRPEVIAAFVAAEVLGAALRARGARAVSDRPLNRHRPMIAASP